MSHGHFAGITITGMGTILMVLVTILYAPRAGKLTRMKGDKKSLRTIQEVT